ncbi:ABC-type antimicrobial peptide transport system permease subunit [Paenibacillus endophyticus]|uniref:ABC-type antimicrobial peptide transport system permease subunit n=1 Tax=Paenibacillus endophyticus TaxID=1294268 RepID=A0A7W5G9H6_9BACL|nr:ABC transporter permease [Paenibacillus endophyticus]MBB3151661.1 ABC-type antimicrobial peptide transport system permease subunit [Paenibacillus endophyticus]
MRISDVTRLSWDQVKRRKVVTGLCAAGISIGCAAIIVAMSIGESAQLYIEKQMNSYLNMDEITVTANSGPQTGGTASEAATDSTMQGKLTEQKLNIMKQMQHVAAASPYQQLNYMEMFTLDGMSSQYQTEVIGTDLEMLTAFGNIFIQGGPSNMEDAIVLNYGATLGLIEEETKAKLQEQLNADPYNEAVIQQYENTGKMPSVMYQKQIQFRYETEGGPVFSRPLRVIGVLKKPSGSSDVQLMYNKKGYVSLQTAARLKKDLKLAEDDQETYQSIIVKVDNQSKLEKVEKQIQKLSVTTQTNLYQKERLANEFKIIIIKAAALGIGVFILIIASISIVVAMTMSTYQRRRQIGIMKVLGANLGQIRNMFIVEAALLGLLGGLLGVLFSYWIVWGINGLIHQLSDEQDAVIIFIPLMTIPIGMAFALATGILSGIYPAISASRTDALTAIKRD